MDILEEFKLEEYTLVGEIGGGSYGSVYELKKDEISYIAKVSENRKCENLKKEYEILQRLQSDHVIKTHGYRERVKNMHVESCIMILEKGDSDLQRFLQMPISRERKLKFFKQIVDAVKFCHSNGIYHRDLKLENIVIVNADKPNEQCKLIDFGVATDNKECFGRAGTIGFIPDEPTFTDSYDCSKADIYALGVILYNILTNRDLFNTTDRRELYNHNSEIFWYYDKDELEGFIPLLDGMLESNPCVRWSIEKIEEYLNSGTITIDPEFKLIEKGYSSFAVANHSKKPLKMNRNYYIKKIDSDENFHVRLIETDYISCIYVFKVTQECFDAFEVGDLMEITEWKQEDTGCTLMYRKSKTKPKLKSNKKSKTKKSKPKTKPKSKKPKSKKSTK